MGALAQPGAAAGLCIQGNGVEGVHAEEAAYQGIEGLQLAHFLCPSLTPRKWSQIL